MFQTEYEFQLPMGYLDSEGNLHRQGTMRLATAADEILPMKDPRVQANSAYLAIILLSRTITRLGSLDSINPKVIEGLFAKDLMYLQNFYNRVNGFDEDQTQATCPHCQRQFSLPGSTAAGGL